MSSDRIDDIIRFIEDNYQVEQKDIDVAYIGDNMVYITVHGSIALKPNGKLTDGSFILTEIDGDFDISSQYSLYNFFSQVPKEQLTGLTVIGNAIFNDAVLEPAEFTYAEYENMLGRFKRYTSYILNK